MHERDNILEAQQLVFSGGRMLMSFPDLNLPDERPRNPTRAIPESLPALFRQSSFDSTTDNVSEVQIRLMPWKGIRES
jgi:hypothetical protein